MYHIKQTLLNFAVISFALLFAWNSYAVDSQLSPSNREVIRVGFPSKFIEPLAITDDNGEIVGLLPSLFKRYAQQAGYEVEIYSYPTFSLVMQAYKMGELDVMIGVTATLERESYMTFSESILAIRRAVISQTPLNSYKELKGKTVATIEGFADKEFLKHILPGTDSLTVPSNREAIRSISLGMADAQIGDGVMLYEHYKNSHLQEQVNIYLLDDLPVDTLYIGVRKSNHVMLERLNKAIREVNEMPEYERILRKWLDERQREFVRKISVLHLSTKEQEWINTNPIVHIGVAADWAPVEIVDSEGYKGIAADVLDEVSSLTGLKFIPKNRQTHQQTYSAFLDGEYDMMSSISPSAQRRNQMSLSQPFMREPWVLLGRVGEWKSELSNDLSNQHTLGILSATYGESMALEYCSGCTIKSYDHIEDLLQAVDEQQIDVAISSLLISSPYIQGQYAGIIKVINSINERSFIPVGFAFLKEDQILLDIINKAISVIPPARLKDIEKKWIQTSYNTGVQVTQVIAWIVAIATISLILICWVFYWNRRLQKEVEQRTLIEDQLKQRVKFERSLLDAIPFPILVRDKNGHMLTSNTAAVQLKAENTTEIELHNIAHLPSIETIFEDDIDDEKIFNGEILPRMEKQIELHNTVKHFSYWKCPYHTSESSQVDGVVTIVNDVTELRNAELRTREAEKRVNELANNVNGVVIQLIQSKSNLSDINFTFVSASIIDFVGISRQELMADHRKFLSLLDKEHQRIFIQKSRTAAKVGLQSDEIRINFAGEDKWLQIQSRVHDNCDTYTWNTVLTDITELKKQQRELEIAKTNAIAATEAKSRFLANMSHEIRTPIGGIVSLLEILQQYPMQEEVVNIHASLTKSSDNLLHIVNDILDFSKIEAGKLEVSPVPIDLHSLLSRTIQTHAPHAHGKGLLCEYWLDPKVASIIEADDVRLGQIFNNFMNNAVKFTDTGKVRFSIEFVSQQDDIQTIRFNISDTGVGISQGAINKLFKPFVQADESTSRKFGGTGLGLSISHQFVEIMGGEINVQSELGQGSTFSVILPFRVIESFVAPINANRKCLMVGDFIQQPDLIAYLQAQKSSILNRTFDNKELMMQSAVGNNIHLLFLSRDDYKRLNLDHQWLSAHLPEISIIILEKSSLLSPEPYDHNWMISVNPLVPEHLQLCLNNPNMANDDRKTYQPTSLQIDKVQTREEAQRDNRIILVAEDHPINRQVINTQLTKLGYHCDIVNDGVEAFNALNEKQYGLLLTDCHMPEMDGYELTRKVRSMERSTFSDSIPIVALTANAIVGESEKCIELGMSDFLSKPIAMEKLRDTLVKWLPECTTPANDELDFAEFDLTVEQLTSITSEHTEVSAKNSIISLDKLVELFGDVETATSITSDFITSQKCDLAELLIALRSDNHASVREITHRMKGAALMLDVDHLANSLSDFEHSAMLGHTDKYTQYFDDVEQFITQLELV
ncbi:transporter substrate-binding domain-containing protein [Aliivibrio kagoshimensis]|uniref:transporter substrate-binding domain-containing protein n=1 Tax=Aliivibrio kagoshimensis TaxID=2910230 RepID=UPI003D0F2662